MIVTGILVMLNIKAYIMSVPLVIFAFLEVIEITSNRIYHWIVRGGELYLNELMVKKFSMLGCTLVLMLNDPSIRLSIDKARDAFYGLVDEDENMNNNNNNNANTNEGDSIAKESNWKSKTKGFFRGLLKSKSSKTSQVSQKASIVLLVSRLFIAVLFIFVGLDEIKRQLAGGIVHKGHVHRRPPGDGHDQLWLKVVELSLAVPFLFGFKTTLVSFLLGVSLVLESLIYWRFWNASAASIGVPYVLHARDHYFTNFGVAGGLFLLQYIGPGKYSVDELLTKKAN